MTKDYGQIITEKLTWILFALVVVAMYFFALDIPFLGPDEPRYSQVAREMFERGDWITTTLGGFDWFEKPALLYWLQIISYKIFGVTEFAARFGSALFGLGTIAALWILGKRVQSSEFGVQSSGENHTLNAKPETLNSFANWLALIAASSLGLIVFSRGASFDIILTFPMTAALVAFFIFEKSDKNSFSIFNFPLLIFYFFIGIALIAKGLIGIVFPLAIVIFYYLLSLKFPSKIFILSLIWGTIFSLIVASVWYVPMYQTNGWKFIDEFFIQHHFQRFSSNKYQHPQPFWFFWLILPLMTIPWLPFFLASVWNFIKVQSSKFKVQEKESLETSASKLKTFAFAWMLVPLFFFSLSGSKLPGYILPALPAALILTAFSVYQFIGKNSRRDSILKLLALLMFLIVSLLLQFSVMDYASHETAKNLVATANANGFEKEKIVNLYTVSHSLEFYGATRTLRDADGKQKRFDDLTVLIDEAKNQPDGRILALVPEKDLEKVLKENTDAAEISFLDKNGEHAIILIQARTQTR